MSNPIYGLRPRGAFVDQRGFLTWEAVKWLEGLLLQANSQASTSGATMALPEGAYAASAGLAVSAAIYGPDRPLPAVSAVYQRESTLGLPGPSCGPCGGLPVPVGDYA